jgi:hypothetical protein
MLQSLERLNTMIHQLMELFPARWLCQSSLFQNGKGHGTVATSKWLELAPATSIGYGDFLLESTHSNIFNTQLLQKQSYHGSDMHQNWRISRDIWTMYAFLPSCKDKLWIASFQTYLMFRTENIWSQLAILSSYHEHG